MSRGVFLTFVGGIALAVIIGSGVTMAGKSPASGESTLEPKCPSNTVEFGPNAENEIQAALKHIVPQAYPQPEEYQVWEVRRILPLARVAPYYGIAKTLCGQLIADRSWLVKLHFPRFLPSASLSVGQLFVIKTQQDWISWYRYH